MSEINRQRVKEVLRRLGVKGTVRGYDYLTDAVLIWLAAPRRLAVVKELYAEVAERNDATVPRVERAMRHAIEQAWKNGGDRAMAEFAPCVLTPSKIPTVSEYIDLVAFGLKAEAGDEETDL